MIEIVLALGVIAIGLVSIMALFPVGLNASRDAIAQNYAAELAETFLTDRYVNAKQDFSIITSLGINKTSSLDSSGLETTPWGATTQLNPTCKLTDHSAGGLWKIVQEKDGIPEFSGAIRMWRDSASYVRYDPNDTDNDSKTPWDEEDFPANVAAQIFVEVSWPLEVPYDRRNKEIFNLEIFNN